MLQQVLDVVLSSFLDVIVYAMIGLTMLAGVIKCLLPVIRTGSALKRAVRRLERTAGQSRDAAWQESRFVGRALQPHWQRFLQNAEQMSLRGMACDTSDYINEDTAIYAPGHAQFAEIIPSLLTSLGILGTFIGLMNGLSGLDVSDAAKTMASIPNLLSGMRYAFATSVAGISCSLAFNMLNRVFVGRAFGALDAFDEAFYELAMARPLDAQVQSLVQQRDGGALVRGAAEEVSGKLVAGVELAIGRALHPVTMAMDNFIAGATREQIDGVQRIVSQFINQMNASLNGQFQALGQTMQAISQSQVVSYDHLSQSMTTAQTLTTDVAHIQQVSAAIVDRFEAFMATLAVKQDGDRVFEDNAARLLAQMSESARQQEKYVSDLQSYQKVLSGSYQDYVSWSEKVMQQLQTRAGEEGTQLSAISGEMRRSAEKLSGSYEAFVGDISEGLSRSLAMFDENMHSLLTALDARMKTLSDTVGAVPETLRRGDERYARQVDAIVGALSKLQKSLTDVADGLNDSRLADGAAAPAAGAPAPATGAATPTAAAPAPAKTKSAEGASA